MLEYKLIPSSLFCLIIRYEKFLLNTPQVIDNPEDIESTIILVITIEKFDSVFDVLPQGYQVPAQHKNFLHFYS